jgi:antitoxin ParD1/3/4
MATMNISLPDDMKAFVEAEAARKGFGTVSEYMRAVIRETQAKTAKRSQVDTLLVEGLDSGPATPFTAEDWESIHRTLAERHAARQEKTHATKKADGR